MTKIPIYKPYLAGKEKIYVNQCLDANWISSKGEFVNKFEKEFVKYTGLKSATTCSNGTAALHLALLALGIKENDEVIVPTFTYIASVNVIKMCNATPIFIDSLLDTLQLDYNDFKDKITKKTKAIIVPHLYGHPCEMDKIMQIAKSNNIYVIEDCAESFGSHYKKEHTGNFGHVATFSFYGNKTITTGEGGMVASNDQNIIEKVKHYKGQGLSSLNPVKKNNTEEYWHDVLGYNYRMTNICAAIGLAQIEKADTIIEKKRQVAEWYYSYLDKDKVYMLTESEEVKSSYWMITVLFENDKIRKKVRQELGKEGIETRPVFPEVHKMPMYKTKEIFKNAESISSRGISLPSYPELEKEEVKFIADTINKYTRDS